MLDHTEHLPQCRSVLVEAPPPGATNQHILEGAVLTSRFDTPVEAVDLGKLQLALTLARMERAKEARLVLDAVMDSSKSDRDLGTYWAPEDRAWLWYNDTIETHAWALRALSEIVPADPRREGLVLGDAFTP